jgi:hypothetical protein
MTDKKKSTTTAQSKPNPTVTVTVVFVDLLRQPIAGLDVRLSSSAFTR